MLEDAECLGRQLRAQFGKEIKRSGARIRESIGPYSRFVRAEGDRLRNMEQELREISLTLNALRSRIERQAA